MTALEILHRECMIFEQIAKLYIYAHKILFNIVNFIVVVSWNTEVFSMQNFNCAIMTTMYR